MKHIFTMAILFVALITSGQKTISSILLDSESGTPLIGANIVGDRNATTSDTHGHFTIEVADEQSELTISYIGYTTLVKLASEIKEHTYLNQSENQLNQIIVSADRDARERTEIPIAVSLISSSVISETQPVQLSELLNKVSGLNMVELGNEQHSMAIRQPISYKSVFLYLEDGIPIRTTGVFNHNALIEINMSSLRSVEVIRGAYSSLYGSDAIGGAINFITKDPSLNPMAHISIQGNNLGYKKAKLGISNTYRKLGLSFNGDYAFRKDGYRSHSDYDKKAYNAKVNYHISDEAKIENSFSYIDYQTDMTGGLDSAYFFGKNYTSQQTFTYRKVKALRMSSKVTHYWKGHNKTVLTGFYRNNTIGQNPHYRIKDDYKPWKGKGDKNLAHSEINDNKFYSLGAILHHQKGFDFLNAKLSAGASIDYSPNSYKAKYIRVHKTDDKIYDSYIETDSILTDYEVDLSNIGAYIQGEISPIKNMKIVAALRYDQFTYDYRNNLDSEAFSGAPDSKNDFSAFTPKVGITYDFGNSTGLYSNYSNGFAPPQVGELYRGVKVPSLEPSIYNNYEIGGWASLFQNKFSLDLSFYQLKGTNEIISVKLDDGSRENRNAGSTNHQGIEYNVIIAPISDLTMRFSGAYSEHTFLDFIEKGKDYSGNEMPGAPTWITNSEIKYKPNFAKGFHIGLEWQHIDSYFMDEKNTAEYGGYDVFNVRMGYEIKGIGFWLHILNAADTLYATSASKSQWGTSYRPGDPRTFNFGVSYNFKK